MRPSVLPKCAALRANAFEHIIDAVNLEVAWQGDKWHRDAVQAEGAVATLAIEMCVHVVEMLAFFTTVARGVAHGIFY